MVQLRRPGPNNKTAAPAKTKTDEPTKKSTHAFYNDDTLGVPVPPVMVISASLFFMCVVFVLHAISKIMA